MHYVGGILFFMIMFSPLFPPLLLADVDTVGRIYKFSRYERVAAAGNQRTVECEQYLALDHQDIVRPPLTDSVCPVM